MRTAVSLQSTVTLPTPEPLTSTHSLSSRDFHVAYRFTDDATSGTAAGWAGYETSDEQSHWIPLDLASRAWSEFIFTEGVQDALQERTPPAEDREFFVERFAAARDRTPEYGYRYVRERLLAMAAPLGDGRLLPDLFAIAERSEGDASDERSRYAAVHAIVRITGVDPRYDDRGRPRPVEAVLEDLRAVCSPIEDAP